MSTIDDKQLSHLFSLSRIKEEKDKKKRKKLLKDLEEILEYFQELQKLDTEDVIPMTGGTFLSDVYRDDTDRILSQEQRDQQRERLVKEFPEQQNDYLKVPGIFDNNKS